MYEKLKKEKPCTVNIPEGFERVKGTTCSGWITRPKVSDNDKEGFKIVCPNCANVVLQTDDRDSVEYIDIDFICSECLFEFNVSFDIEDNYYEE